MPHIYWLMCLRHYAENKSTLNKPNQKDCPMTTQPAQTIQEIQINKAELHARIEIAKADSNKQGVTVNTGK